MPTLELTLQRKTDSGCPNGSSLAHCFEGSAHGAGAPNQDGGPSFFSSGYCVS
ncbi:MAG: hypothetical protein L6461_07415 [Anaerolineae bacterium]|nr:hypothetical protein [Anaerolineae bacterium]